ncbi:MAG: CDC48 family AAA ATPase [DPANN group archaeon]|nr:CDC48 family AAA ATPase [DPANN group archaeon]
MGRQEIRLKVAEAIQDDVNKGIVRIDTAFMKEIDVRPGDIVEIEGQRKTVGIVDRAYPGDIGLSIIRTDGIIRRNAKTGIGENVTIRKAEVKEAKRIKIGPASKGIMIRASSNIFKQGLLGRAVVKGDIVSLGGTRRRRNTMSQSPFFNDIFNIIDDDMVGLGFGDIKFIVADTTPGDAVLISELTEVEFNPEAVEIDDHKILEVTYEDIGGLQEEITKIREMVELPLKHPELFERMGIDAPKGVLLHGPPGTGKTLLAKAVANETNSHFIVINGPEIMSKYYGQSEENLRKKFEEAEKNAPAIIFIDEVDAIASKREEAHGEVERRVVAQLLAIMDGLKSRGKVVVIAATNIPNSLDPALRRPGRFDREVEIGVPSMKGRHSILQIHTRYMPLYSFAQAIKDATDIEEAYKEAMMNIMSFMDANGKASKKSITNAVSKYLKSNPEKNDFFKQIDSEKLYKYWHRLADNKRIVNLDELAHRTHGFVGADLSALAKEAAMIVLRRILPDLKLKEDEPIPKETLEKLIITHKDFIESLKVVRPSALREVLIERPNVTWDMIGGLADVKQSLMEAVEWPISNPEAFTRMGVTPPKGILLYGPPGTGKTLLAKAVANESEANFILVKGPELISKWVGESEKGIRKIFDKARQASPAIVFFDEIDSIAARRGMEGDNRVGERVVNQLLTEMDGLTEMNDIVVLAATNRPDILDTALLRPGRFDRIIMCTVPDAVARKKIFDIHTKKMPLDNDVDLMKLAEITEGYVGADIEGMTREAAIMALRDDIKAKKISKKHFDKAREIVKPSVSKDIIENYKQLENFFRQAKAKQMQEEKPSYMG